MIIYNRRTEGKLLGAHITFDRSHPGRVHFRFDAKASLGLGLAPYTYVEFTFMADEWFVAVTNHEDGYRLVTSGGKQKNCFRCNAKDFVLHFLGDRKIKSAVVHYRLIPTSAKLGDYQLFKLFFDGSKP